MRHEIGHSFGGIISTAAPRSEPRHVRLVGEKTPAWVAHALVFLGTALAVASSSLWLNPSLVVEQLSAVTQWSATQSPLQQEQPRLPLANDELNILPSEPDPALALSDTKVQQPLLETDANSAERKTIGVDQREVETAKCLPIAAILFARNSARLNSKGLEADVTVLSRWVAEHKDSTLSVEGHADASGTEQYNVLLSYSRAKAVIAWLIGQGIPERQMVARAAGSSYAKDVEEQAGNNRRVVLRVEGVASCR